VAVLRIILRALVLLSLALVAATAVPGAEEPSEYQVKAAFLLNFVRFVEWPVDVFKKADDPLVVGILGKDPFEGTLEQTVTNKTVGGRSVVVRHISDVTAARTCQVVFLAASETRRLGDIVTAGRGVLIVGEAEGLAERGGMINFVVQDNHVRFEINPSAATRAGLKISSKLLQLAIVVPDKGQGK
jgi:hypothetical protein